MQSSLVLCMGSSAFLIVDLTSHRQQHIFRVWRQPPCSCKFACLGNHPILATRKGATVKVAKAKCYYCSSKQCLQFCPFETRCLHEMRLRKNYSTPVQFKASHHVVVVLPVLGATLVLPVERVRVLKLQEQGATTVLQSCACHLAHLSPDLYSKGSSARIICLGQLVSSCHRLKLLRNRDCAYEKVKLQSCR